MRALQNPNPNPNPNHRISTIEASAQDPCLGLIAGDAECYELYKDLFHRVLSEIFQTNFPRQVSHIHVVHNSNHNRQPTTDNRQPKPKP